MEYQLGEKFEKEIEKGYGDLPDIGYPIPDQRQNEFELSIVKLKDC